MKIVVLHNEIKPFRAPLFQHLQKNYDLKFYCLRKNKATLNQVNNVFYGRYIRIPKMQDLEIPLDLWSFLSKEKPDVIISTDLGYGITYIGYFFATLNKAKFVLWNEQWCDIRHPRRRLTRFYEKKICKGADLILSFGRKHGKYLETLGANKSKIVNLPNAVPDIQKSGIQKYANEFIEIKSDNIFNIVCPGRLVKFKGQTLIIDAIEKVVNICPNIHVYILGEGPQYLTLLNKIKQCQLEKYITITGSTYTSDERNMMFEKADLVILSSQRSNKIRGVEAWGLVINEALQFNNKIIVSDATGVADELIIDKATGRVFDNQSALQLSELIISAINEPAVWDKYVSAAVIKLNSEFSMDILIKKFCGALDTLLEEK